MQYEHQKLVNGDSLNGDDYLASPNGLYYFTLQAADGNICIYRGNPLNKAAGVSGTWCAYTQGQGVNRLTMQPDGNLCAYSNAHPTYGNGVWCAYT